MRCGNVFFNEFHSYQISRGKHGVRKYSLQNSMIKFPALGTKISKKNQVWNFENLLSHSKLNYAYSFSNVWIAICCKNKISNKTWVNHVLSWFLTFGDRSSLFKIRRKQRLSQVFEFHWQSTLLVFSSSFSWKENTYY